MPKVEAETVPENLRPYHFHGVDLDWKSGGKEATGDCPFCGREGKFSVVVQTGQWRCFVCNEGEDKGKAVKGGNAHVFIRKLWEYSAKATNGCKELAAGRGYVSDECLLMWEVVKSVTTGHWLIPGYNAEGALNQLYLYRKFPQPTPTLGHQLHGVNLYDASKPIVDLCEGPWDGIAWWEMLSQVKDFEGKLSQTGNVSNSLLVERNVLAVPGCGTFLESWLPLFAGKVVTLLYDNDLPRTHPKTGATIAPGGLEGMKRVARILSESPEPPESINYLKWGEEHYNTDLPHGHDLRDYLNNV